MTTWLETDLEPDDVLALRINPWLKETKYYVVGEGDSNVKYNRMRRYARLLGRPDVTIIEGLGSEASFPHDGGEFDNLEREVCTEDYLPHFIEFASSPSPVMISLKPMRELLAAYIHDEKSISKLLQNVELYAYGGFNFRCLLEHEAKLLELLHCFKKVSIYESVYVTGHDNSVNKDNFPWLDRHCKDQPLLEDTTSTDHSLE